MRPIFLLCLLLCSFNKAYAQTEKADITATLDSYFRLVEDKKISELLDYVHPKLLGMMGREMFEQQYEQFFNAPNMDMSMEHFSQDSISEVLKLEGSQYAMVQYSFQMTLVMKSMEDNETAGKTMASLYKKQFGEENVTEPKAGTYVIKGNREMFACQEPEFEGWKILDYEPGMKMILTQLLPAAVFKHFNK